MARVALRRLLRPRGPRTPAPTSPRRSAVVPIWDLSALPRRHVVSRLILLTLVVSVAVISVISVTRAMTWADRPFAGFLVNERLVLGNIGQYHWTGTEAGLKWPDKILRADGRAMTSMGDLDETVRRAELGSHIRDRRLHRHTDDGQRGRSRDGRDVGRAPSPRRLRRGPLQRARSFRGTRHARGIRRVDRGVKLLPETIVFGVGPSATVVAGPAIL